MTSERPAEAYVWVWLPGRTDPVVVGRLEQRGDVMTFNYGRSYLDRDDAVPLYAPELPLRPGRIEPLGHMEIAGCMRDAAPDAWGQRVIRHRLADAAADPSILGLLLLSDSDRFGALDFQRSPDRYESRTGGGTLEQLLTVSELVNAGKPIPDGLAHAALRGTSLGGARPKAPIVDDGRHLVAKFSLSTDVRNVVGGEAVAMELARRAGVDVCPTTMVTSGDHDVLLVERFDRDRNGGRRRAVSALTVLGLSAYPEGRYATYTALADKIRQMFVEPAATLRELFSRIAFNMCVTNTDDHARNHAALVEDTPTGMQLRLSPAYDIEPRPRTGDTAEQAMAYGPAGERETRFAPLVQSATSYHLDVDEAREIVDEMVETITDHYEDAADQVGLPPADRDALWRRQILHPSLVYGYDGRAARLVQ